ncbi:PREDICTED: serine protease easter-like [Papilio xuthus]|uniref:Serine protease easter-like n=1 Tax=Papilio xuthus TaxID=66420 RepID=A0AAJ6ZET7_PAPXU|nr:PREDICTED: serine protease easter-like [Papilio xuthus]
MSIIYWNCVVIIITIVSHTSGDTWQQVASHPSWKKLESFECGFSAADRIIGGLNAALGQFPWILRLGYTLEGEDDLDWMCGGVLVTDRHVVTAAHCVKTADDGIKLVSIRAGEYDTRTDPDCQTGVCAPPLQDRQVKAIRSHASFNKPPFHNDIAIIELDSPLDLNDYVAPICLPQQDQLTDLRIGELVTAAGWGKMNMSTDQRADILQYVSLPVLKPESCGFFGKGFKVEKSEICAGSQRNKDACGGDSGGPLMKIFDTAEGPKSFLVGVVSFGPTVCGIKKPGVYTSIPYFIKWILDNIA